MEYKFECSHLLGVCQVRDFDTFVRVLAEQRKCRAKGVEGM